MPISSVMIGGRLKTGSRLPAMASGAAPFLFLSIPLLSLIFQWPDRVRSRTAAPNRQRKSRPEFPPDGWSSPLLSLLSAPCETLRPLGCDRLPCGHADVPCTLDPINRNHLLTLTDP